MRLEEDACGLDNQYSYICFRKPLQDLVYLTMLSVGSSP